MRWDMRSRTGINVAVGVDIQQQSVMKHSVLHAANTFSIGQMFTK